MMNPESKERFRQMLKRAGRAHDRRIERSVKGFCLYYALTATLMMPALPLLFIGIAIYTVSAPLRWAWGVLR